MQEQLLQVKTGHLRYGGWTMVPLDTLYSVDYFLDFVKFKDLTTVSAANNQVMQAMGQGTIHVKSTVGQKNQILKLNGVWYVPDISKNLFSVLIAQDNNPKNSRFLYNCHYLLIDSKWERSHDWLSRAAWNALPDKFATYCS